MSTGPYPSKLVTEAITIDFEFLDLLDFGESIVSAQTEIDVLVGVDTFPISVRSTTAISGSTVRQRVRAGLPGVIYNVVCSVTGSSGQVYQKTQKLAVLPDNARTPLFSSEVFTTELYPLLSYDVVHTYSVPASGYFLGAFRDAAVASTNMLSGSLDDVLRFYTAPLDNARIVNPDLIVGELYDGTIVKVLYSYEEFAKVVNPALLTGTLSTVLIKYQNWPVLYRQESVKSYAGIVSGVLS